MISNQSLPKIGTLWIGEHLSPLELVCLKSFADAGHDVTLYTYGELRDRPDFVEIGDARSIWDPDDILVHTDRNSPAIHSDIFRIKMIQKTQEIWVDTDVYCIKPFYRCDGYIFAPAKQNRFSNAVLGLPSTSPALAALDQFLAGEPSRPLWWTDRENDIYLYEHTKYDFETMRWGTTGPLALDWFIRATGEAHHGFSQSSLYPLSPAEKKLIFKRPMIVNRMIQDDTIGIHFFASGTRPTILSGEFATTSYFGRLCAKHGIAI